MELFKGITAPQFLITLDKLKNNYRFYSYRIVQDYLFKLCNTPGAYLETPPTVDEEGEPIQNPVEEAKDEYICYLINWGYKYPLFSDAISKAIDNLDKYCEQFDYYIEKAQNHIEKCHKIETRRVA